MSPNNLDYLYQHLPARFRRDDSTELLRRFLSFFGATLDGWDETFDNFHKQIDPASASEEFIDWWLWELFAWAWFPSWYTLAEKRAFYSEVSQHYARRGTAAGIERLLFVFGIHSRVYSRPQYWGEFIWGDGGYTVDRPLALLVQIQSIDDRVNFDGQFWGAMVWGDGTEGNYGTTLKASLQLSEIEALLQFEQPMAQAVGISYAGEHL